MPAQLQLRSNKNTNNDLSWNRTRQLRRFGQELGQVDQ
jgi:hypothetical protein